MRRAGIISDESQAQRFADFLLTRGIEARVDGNADGWAVWIIDEKHLDQGREELQQFLDSPDDPRYDGAAREAETIRKETAEKHRQQKKNVVQVRDRWRRPLAQRAPVTFALMVISVVAFLFTEYFDESARVESILLITMPPATARPDAAEAVLAEVQRGQVWRLVTPIFLHFHILHIVFNMWMLHFFGTQIESKVKPWQMALLVLAIALPSNLGQYIASAPNEIFGGMSGVVYGLFGFVWLKMNTNPWSGYYLQRSTVVILLVWLILCMTPWSIVDVANTAHVVGLASGAIVGAAPYLWRKLRPPEK